MPYCFNEMKMIIKNTLGKIEDSIYSPLVDLNITAWSTKEPVAFENRTDGKKALLKVGDKWGELWDCAWFNFTGTVPESAKGKNVVILIDLSGEGCVFDKDGCPYQGLTTYSSQFEETLGRPGKKVLRFKESADGGEKINIWLDAGCNDLFGNYKDSGTIKQACISLVSTEMRDLYYDFKVLCDLYNNLPEKKARAQSILFALYNASNLLVDFTDGEAAAARKILSKELNKKNGDASLEVSAVGHAHIDLAWLWPMRETIRKAARTFSTALRMMDYYPDYVFGASQPQLYQWMKDYYPALYEKIKEKIKSGRWETQGAMWVESDTNIPCGESLIRQIYYGKKFFMDEFSKEEKILWLPDVFGYTAALPQILKKSGVDYFMTIKLSWSKIDVYPHNTFFWQGIDGSKILSHLPPEGTYNSPISPSSVAKTENLYQDSGVSDNCLMLFGIGDGGGGPGEEHLEMLKREKNLAGLPPVTQEPAIDFFKKLEKNSENYKTWNGELYLEAHQGTYTTQSENKRYNREMENLMHETELLSSFAQIQNGCEYPKEKLEAIWKVMLLYQFHDIIPGSAIGRVYKESREKYKIIEENLKKIQTSMFENIAKSVDTSTSKKPVFAFNTLGFERKAWIENSNKWSYEKVPSTGYTVVDADKFISKVNGLSADDNTLENDLLTVKFNNDGTIASIIDKESDREVIEGKAANRLSVYQDDGDAWEFPLGYRKKKSSAFKLESKTAELRGPYALLHCKYSFGSSHITQTVRLTKFSKRVDFITSVDWNEKDKMLRTSFPISVSSSEATCEIQFGNIKRPTTSNTSWEMAKFEVCAQRWVDISENNYGVSLLANCKYGYSVTENCLDLNLLRSTHYPDTSADIGYHAFTYSLMPHCGDYIKGDVVKAGYDLNFPVIAALTEKHSKAKAKPITSLLSVDSDDVVIETVKKAENSDNTVVRLYECHGTHTKAKLNINFAHKNVTAVDLMEQNIDSSKPIDDGTMLSFTPFEIKTLLIER